MRRHYVASVYIVHKQKVLLHRHQKLDEIIPVGGQIRANETPQEAALREVKEETGLLVTFISDCRLLRFTDSIELICPVHIMLEEASAGHQCVDFVFYAAADTWGLTPQDGESKGLMWLNVREIKAHPSVSDYVRHLALELLHSQEESAV